MVYSIVVLMEVPAGLGRKSPGLTAEDSLSVRKVSETHSFGLHIGSRWTDGLCQRHFIRVGPFLEQACGLFPGQTALYRASTRKAGQSIDLHLRWIGHRVIVCGWHTRTRCTTMGDRCT